MPLWRPSLSYNRFDGSIHQPFGRRGVMTKVTADVLFGDGTRLFDRQGPEQVKLVGTRVIDSSAARHFTFKMVD